MIKADLGVGKLFSAIFGIYELSFWLRAVNQYTMSGFEFHEAIWHLPFLPRSGQSRYIAVFERSKTHWASELRSFVFHRRTLSFWLRAMNPWTISRFDCRWPTWHLPFLPRSGQSQHKSEFRRNWKICGGIYFSASIHIWTLSFWLKAENPYTIRPSGFHWLWGHLPFLPRSGQSQHKSV